MKRKAATILTVAFAALALQAAAAEDVSQIIEKLVVVLEFGQVPTGSLYTGLITQKVPGHADHVA